MADLSFAENRFGLGPRGDTSAVGGDPRGWASAQLTGFQSQVAGVPSRREVAEGLADYLQMQRDARMERRQDPPVAAMMTPADMHKGEQAKKQIDPAVRMARREGRETYARLVAARVNSALVTTTPFLERMAHFWANHFAVSAQKQTTLGFAGLMEMEAIRPHVTGRFGDMLLAVERHPAMLFYLDQAQSIGPNSPLGTRAAARGNNRGLNENLAREILELHTLGVRTGYAQADVTEFARALTGWTVAGIARGPGARFAAGAPGDYAFVDLLHEPGARTVLGRKFAEGGEEQGRAVLAMLAVHPATARHVATKLARHFAADIPPPAMVADRTRVPH